MISLIYFFLIFILEGIGVLSNEYLFFLYALVVPIYYLENFFLKNKKNFFLYYSNRDLFFVIFFVYLVFNIFFSVDKINSINKTFIYFLSFFIFTIGKNEKKCVNTVKYFIFIASGVFCFYSMIINLRLVNIKVNSPYQFVFPTYPNHNHLGDFLGLTLIYLFFNLLKFNFFYLFYFVFLFVFFIVSFSRSAYVDLMIVLFILIFTLKQIQKHLKKMTLGIIFFLVLFFIMSQQEIYKMAFLLPLKTFLHEQLNFNPRPFISGRLDYWHQGLLGFLEKPFFGWGLGNYIYLSNKYVSSPLQTVHSALNLPISLLAELGIFGFILFVFLLFKLINWKKAYQKNKVYFFLVFYQILNFQTDYTYSILGFYLLFFLFLGILSENRQNLVNELAFNFTFFLFTFLIFLRLTGEVFVLSGNYYLAKFFYPFNHKIWHNEIYKNLHNGNKQKALLQANMYYQLSSYSLESIDFFSEFYTVVNDKRRFMKEINLLESNWHYPPFTLLKKTYQLVKKNFNKQRADNHFLKFYSQLKQTFFYNSFFADEVYQFCFQENIPSCRFRHFYIPRSNTKEKTDKSLPYQATYTFNNDGLNERFNYSRKKPKNVFRIAVLGGGEAFGFLVNTKDNWVERLEDYLGSKLITTDFQKYEVLNFAYHSYDLGYQVERFLTQAKDYQPDLIIWLNNDFYRLNEIFLPITEEIEAQIKLNQEKEKYQKQGIYFPSWQLAYKEYEKKVNQLGLDVDQIQIDYLNEVFSSYKKPIIFISFYEAPERIRRVLEQNTCYFYYPEFTQPEYQFEKTGGLNYQGQEKLAEKIFEIIINNDLSYCLRKDKTTNPKILSKQ